MVRRRGGPGPGPVCRSLLAHGQCQQGNCAARHDLPNCTTCNRFFDSVTNLEYHLNGRAHFQVAAQVARPQPPSTSAHRCEGCGALLQAAELVAHTNSPRHLQALRLQRHKAAKIYAEAPKNGVSVLPSGDFDFGHVEHSTRPPGETRKNINAQIVAGDTGFILVRLRLRDAPVGQRLQRRHFTMTSIGEPVYVKPNSAFHFQVYFNSTRTLGRYEDTIELDCATFPGPGQGIAGEKFTIHRTVRAVVAVQADVDQFAPTTPYVAPTSRRQRQRARERDTVRGPRSRMPQNIPWVGKLGFYDIPPKIKAVLDCGEIKEQIKLTYQHLLPVALSYTDYREWWSTLLYIEQAQLEIDVRSYDIDETTLDARGNIFFLGVPGLAEKRPSVLKGDSIKVQASNSGPNDKWFDGTVSDVLENSACVSGRGSALRPDALRFSYSNGRYNVQFLVSRIPARRMHHALNQPLPPASLLFPLKPTPSSRQVVAPSFFDNQIRDNNEQAQAVAAILNKTHGDSPFIIFGPPGTGKTVTLIEACRQLLADYVETKILIAAPSNSACDLLVKRLQLPPDQVLRLMAPSRSKHEVPAEVQPFCFEKDGTFACPKVDKLATYRVIVTTCISASILEGVGLPRATFTHICIDEAGQALEVEALLPLTLATSATSVVLAGDPKQLGPITRSKVAQHFKYDTSLLERLMSTELYNPLNHSSRGIYFTKLVQNFRSHPTILKYPNKKFYDNELVTMADRKVSHRLENWNGWSTRFPIIFHAVQGQDDREGTSPSFFNTSEISLVKMYYEKLRSEAALPAKDIGVISPYAAQARRLRRSIADTDTMVGSTEQFQGQERGAMIISTVRSNKAYLETDKRFALGFLSSEKRFNVAVTRAQAGLIIIGDPDILALEPLWRNFLIYVHRNGGWAGQEWDAEAFADATYGPAQVGRDGMDALRREMEALQMADARREALRSQIQILLAG